jgi:hypothetical protein
MQGTRNSMMSYFYRFRPDGRGTFSCLPKRKYPKRTAPGGLPDGVWGGLPEPDTLGLIPLDPGLRSDDETTSRSGDRYTTTSGAKYPLVQPSIAAISGLSEPPCRAGFASRQAQILRVRRAPEMARSAGNPRSGQASGIAFLLGTFLWRSKEKYLAVRAKPGL